MAANDAILLNTSKTLGLQIVSAANQLRAFKNSISDLNNQLAHLTVGGADNATNYQTLEAQTGAPAGQGKTLYDLIILLQTQVNSSGAVADFSTKVLTSN